MRWKVFSVHCVYMRGAGLMKCKCSKFFIFLCDFPVIFGFKENNVATHEIYQQFPLVALLLWPQRWLLEEYPLVPVLNVRNVK